MDLPSLLEEPSLFVLRAREDVGGQYGGNLGSRDQMGLWGCWDIGHSLRHLNWQGSMREFARSARYNDDRGLR